MAATEGNGERRQLFERLARVEDRHVQRWTAALRGSQSSVAVLPHGAAHARAGLGRAAIRQRADPAAHARGRGARGAGVSRPGTSVDRPADPRRGGRHRVGLGHARARALGGDGARGRAVARRRCGRLPPQRRVRIQRRADGELRPGRRRHRRQRRPAHRHRQRHRGGDRRCAVDGRQRLPRGEERGGSAGAPDRDGAATRCG